MRPHQQSRYPTDPLAVTTLGNSYVFPSLVVASLVLCVRPLQVFLATRGSELSLRERSFIAWVAPRGIVAAAIASIVGRSLESAGVAGGVELRALAAPSDGCTRIFPTRKVLGLTNTQKI